MAKKVMKHLMKKPVSKGSSRPRIEGNAQTFRKHYYDLVRQPPCLAYPASGGRRPDLALACKPWILKTDALGGSYSWRPKTVISGFLAIHASRKLETDEAGNTGEVSEPQIMEYSGREGREEWEREGRAT